ncbi:hypothetical protein D9619_001726 [Psilocybe cf. subviscida]|uniref:Uncharacterized protein n=1 Tax=Psilocybe cf. subviscida TaxID=2480587 RepID=A0A8H5F3B1_9AGAR|nr:hypothetical protein D9619_001726 [Psilocybe cf. subviscida]
MFGRTSAQSPGRRLVNGKRTKATLGDNHLVLISLHLLVSCSNFVVTAAALKRTGTPGALAATKAMPALTVADKNAFKIAAYMRVASVAIAAYEHDQAQRRAAPTITINIVDALYFVMPPQTSSFATSETREKGPEC